MIRLGLVGKNLKHSKSQEIYEKILGEKLDYKFLDYNSENEIPSLESIFTFLDGLSITAPYKSHFISELKLSPEIKNLGAVNCIRKRNGFFEGNNSDYLALKDIFLNLNLFQFSKIIILGDGAMANITKAILQESHLIFDQFSRKLNSNFSQLDIEQIYSGSKKIFIINTCSRSYVYTGKLPAGAIFYDYNYSHEHEKIIPREDVQYFDGLTLLRQQAEYAVHFFLN